jgi:hypothetical protein
MKKIIKALYGTLFLLAASFAVSACSTADIDEGNNITTTKINIAAFPAFTSATRSVGTYDAGKTAWANGDVILLKVTDTNGSASAATATYNGTTWTLSNDLTSTTQKATVEAYYAPNYEWNSNNALTLKSGKTAGTDEMLSYKSATAVDVTSTISITFAARTYSRLRIASSPNTTIAFTCAEFTPVGTTTAGVSAVSLTTDAKGNAYMYGSWTATSTMAASITVDDTPYSLASKSVTTVPSANLSYALNAIPTGCNKIGAGSSTSPYRIYNATQLQDMSTNAINVDKYFKLESDINWPTTSNFSPIGNADNPFIGNFDGDGHSISNLTVKDTSNGLAGLFGYYAPANENYSLKNVTLKNPNITTSYTDNAPCLGALCGYMGDAYLFKLENCHVIGGVINYQGSATEACVGGLVGEIYNTTSGESYDFSVLGCSADASVTCASTISGYDGIGGLIGISANVSPLTIKGSFFHGSVYTPSKSNVGLVYGLSYFTPTVTSVYYQSTMTGTGYVTTESNANATKVDGTTTTWSTAVMNMNDAISNDITGYQYVLKEGASCPVMEKK